MFGYQVWYCEVYALKQ